MKPARLIPFLLFAHAACAADDFIDRIDDYLALSAFHGNVRARLSGTFDLEAYFHSRPAPGLLFTDHDFLLNPRLTLFLDAQIGSKVYAFVQSRVDRGFDPSETDARMRLDEYALRFTPWEDGRLNVQIGQFASVVGSWIPRHGSWENPFITAPVPYENLTGVWDSFAPDSAETLLDWSHAYAGATAAEVESDKYLRNPVIWGPSYATGISVAGRVGPFEYAAEMKNASLASRPETWALDQRDFDHPTYSGRVGFQPNPMWHFGVSASAGPFLLPSAAPWLPPGKGIGDYREIVLGQDISFAWHHLQLWAEFYETRFELPGLGHVDTFAYYLEAKYKFTPQLFGALRWNQQLYGNVRQSDGTAANWGRDLWRIDTALGFRPTAHTQLKLQYSFQQEDFALHEITHTIGAQFTLRF